MSFIAKAQRRESAESDSDFEELIPNSSLPRFRDENHDGAYV